MRYVSRVCSRIGALEKDTRDRCLYLIAALSDQGIGLRVTAGYRSYVEQAALYAQGRKPLEHVNRLRGAMGLAAIEEDNNVKVTNAGPGFSWHNWKRAFDVVPMVGGVPEWDDDGLWNTIGAVGIELGLEWGGTWQSLVDKPHFQYRDQYTLDLLREQYPHGL